MVFCLTINCDEPWFSFIKKGKKPVEGRKSKKKYRNLKPGDKVLFKCIETQESFLATVLKVECYDSLTDYLKAVTLEKALPGISSFSEGLKIYSQWSTSDEIKVLGFVAIWIKPD
jgi:ASC-1-like (ASCH) protein